MIVKSGRLYIAQHGLPDTIHIYGSSNNIVPSEDEGENFSSEGLKQLDSDGITIKKNIGIGETADDILNQTFTITYNNNVNPAQQLTFNSIYVVAYETDGNDNTIETLIAKQVFSTVTVNSGDNATFKYNLYL